MESQSSYDLAIIRRFRWRGEVRSLEEAAGEEGNVKGHTRFFASSKERAAIRIGVIASCRLCTRRR